MQRVQQFLKRSPLTHNGTKINISLSYGITSIKETGIKNAAGLLKQSDEKLYGEKKRKSGATGC